MGGQISVNNPIRRRELRIQYLSKEYVKSHDVKSVLYLAQSKYIVSFNVAKPENVAGSPDSPAVI